MSQTTTEDLPFLDISEIDLGELHMPVCVSGEKAFVNMEFLVSEIGNAVLECGTIIDYIGVNSSLPSVFDSNGNYLKDSWLVCDGSSFDQNLYPELYQKLKTNVLPDLTNRVTMMSDSIGETISHDTGSGRANSENTTLNLEVDHLPPHTHEYIDKAIVQFTGTDKHGTWDFNKSKGPNLVSKFRTGVSHETGGGSNIDLRQPFFTTRKIIKAV